MPKPKPLSNGEAAAARAASRRVSGAGGSTSSTAKTVASILAGVIDSLNKKGNADDAKLSRRYSGAYGVLLQALEESGGIDITDDEESPLLDTNAFATLSLASQKEIISGFAQTIADAGADVATFKEKLSALSETADAATVAIAEHATAAEVAANENLARALKIHEELNADRDPGFLDKTGTLLDNVRALQDIWGNRDFSSARGSIAGGDILGSFGSLEGFSSSMGAKGNAMLAEIAENAEKGIGVSAGKAGLARALAGLGKAVPVLGWLSTAAEVAQFADSLGDDIAKSGGLSDWLSDKTDTFRMGLDAQIGSFTEVGISSADIEAIQKELLSADVKYGSSTWREGQEWAKQAMRDSDYQISGGVAAKMFTEYVVKAGASVEELTETFNYLNEQTKDASETLDSWSGALQRSLGMNDKQASQMAVQMGNVLASAGVDPATQQIVQKAMTQYGNDAGFNMLVDQYMQSNGGDMAAAYEAAAMDYAMLYDPTLLFGSYGNGMGEMMSVVSNGQTAMDLLRAGDVDALTSWASGSAGAGAAIRSMSTALGIGNEEDLPGMVEALAGAFSGAGELSDYLGTASSIAAGGKGASIANERWELSIKIDGPLAVADLQKSVDQSNLDAGR